MGRPVTNKHKVPAKEWKVWSNARKLRYNKIMHGLRLTRQIIYLPYTVPIMQKGDWQVLRHNIAWVLSDELT